MTAILALMIWAGYDLVYFGWYYAHGAPVRLTDTVLPSRRSQLLTSLGQSVFSGITLAPGATTPKKATQASAVVNPGLGQGRTDQGVDFTGAGPVTAVAPGIINLVDPANPGWGASAGGVDPGGVIGEALTSPPTPQESEVYYAEGLTPQVQTGQQVAGGETIASAGGGGIEEGFANPSNPTQPLSQVVSGPYSGSGPTALGTAFANWLASFGSGS